MEEKNDAYSANSATERRPKAILVLHGNKQTGELFLGRLGSLRRKLLVRNKSKSKKQNGNDLETTKKEIDTYLVAPDAPFQYVSYGSSGKSIYNSNNRDNINELDDSSNVRTWWIREGDGSACAYKGLEETIDMLHSLWVQSKNYTFEGILGFSQGARLGYLISYLHVQSSQFLFPGLKYVILSGGYGHLPLPVNLTNVREFLFQKCNIPSVNLHKNEEDETAISIPSLHIVGLRDKVILPSYSRDLLNKFQDATLYEHDGGHFMPMKAKDIEIYLRFIEKHSGDVSPPSTMNQQLGSKIDQCLSMPEISEKVDSIPDEEHTDEQINECEALEVIYPNEYLQISAVNFDPRTGKKTYSFPIEYQVSLLNCEGKSISSRIPSSIALRVRYPIAYPDESALFSLDHAMNSMQFSSELERKCLQAVREAAAREIGMPCAMSCILAAKDFFENFGDLEPLDEEVNDSENFNEPISDERLILGIPANSKIIEKCDEEGQKLADMILKTSHSGFSSANEDHGQQALMTSSIVGKSTTNSGLWKYTIGLVGKPSAGKSTFFNAATAFARQQREGDSSTVVFGASMAPHPFTTIDPNVGFCFVPALPGACPEDSLLSLTEKFAVGSTHGRDYLGRRLIPICLKDVAGLVPGAYKGRGRGNKFLDDLTDADVLIHVLDASGTADADGNFVGMEGGVHPLQDLAWVRKELLEWVSCNMEAKWETVKRKGKNRLAEMFSGYKQSQAFVWSILENVEKSMASNENKRSDHALDHMEDWNGGDLRRLINAFLGVRFPMALALNKSDMPSASQYISDICGALPVHGAHVGVALSAKQEMEVVRSHLEMDFFTLNKDHDIKGSNSPIGVWNCLQSAMSLRQPILVFPVSDMFSYDPLPGMTKYATLDPSLPSPGLIHCFESSGGRKPTLWDERKGVYHLAENSQKIPDTRFRQPLRDVLVMKPGSTVEDVFDALRKLGAVRGDYVRAECSGNIGEKPRLVRKEEKIDRSNRILKIMTNKRT